jgi:ribosomal protein L7/L12
LTILKIRIEQKVQMVHSMVKEAVSRDEAAKIKKELEKSGLMVECLVID